MHPIVQHIWENHGATDSPLPEDGDGGGALRCRNPHPRDCNIRFEDARHLYAVTNGQVWLFAFLTSVTKVIDYCTKPFPMHTIAGAIARKQERLEDEYFAKDRSYLKLLPRKERERVLEEHFGEYMGLITAEDVSAHWRKGTLAGTKLHLDIERHLNGLPPLLEPSLEWEQYMCFLQDHCDMEVYRTEWRLFSEELLITGTIDCAVVSRRDQEGRVTHVKLLDWKRAKNLHDVGQSKTKLLEPLNHLVGSSIVKYSIQLNMYRRLLHMHYGIEVDEMFIVAFHPNYNTYQKVPVPVMDKEIDLLLGVHLRALEDKIKLATLQ